VRAECCAVLEAKQARRLCLAPACNTCLLPCGERRTACLLEPPGWAKYKLRQYLCADLERQAPEATRREGLHMAQGRG